MISTATSTKREETETLEDVDLNGSLNLIEAAVDVGVKHFIYTSAYGSKLDDPLYAAESPPS